MQGYIPIISVLQEILKKEETFEFDRPGLLPGGGVLNFCGCSTPCWTRKNFFFLMIEK